VFFKLSSRLLLLILFAATAYPLLSQVVPTAVEGGLPLTVGAGISDFNTDWRSTGSSNGPRMEGISVWVDWNFYHAPSFLHGLGVEVEGRDINFGRPSTLSNMRQDTAAGGPIYTFRRYRNIHPYAKFLVGFGSVDFPSPLPNYHHDTRSFYSPGVGVEYRVFHNFWARGEWEYQSWSNFPTPNSTFHPNGFTVGASYNFRHFRGDH
jgi:opacity protein-like surface antigen